MKNRVKLLIVDDSSLFVDSLRLVLAGDSSIEFVGVATDGASAVRKVADLQPDVITMDMNMPGMSGLEAIQRIMSTRPTPIMIMTSDPTYLDAQRCFDALSHGALELIIKPDFSKFDEMESYNLRERIRFLAKVPVVHHVKRRDANGSGAANGDARDDGPGVIGVVASTGGPILIADVMRDLPASFPLPIVVVQHLATGFAPHFVSWLGSCTGLTVKVAEDGMRAEPGGVYLAPDGSHLQVGRRGRLRLDKDKPALNGHKPSGDLLLSSIARSYGAQSAGFVLTGMGRDGVEGLTELSRAGGITVAQDAATSVVDGMPKAARDAGVVQRVVPKGKLVKTFHEVANTLVAGAARLRGA